MNEKLKPDESAKEKGENTGWEMPQPVFRAASDGAKVANEASENQTNNFGNPPTDAEPEIITNDYGATRDGAVVVEEQNRTVLLTDDETIVIEKEPRIDVAPKNRPRKVYAGMWGTAELVTVGVAMLAILTTILLFILVVLPAKKELKDNQAKRDSLEMELLSSRAKYGTITTTEKRVAEIVGSVDDFESRFLPNATIGRTALYQRLNGLIAAYGLVNTTGPDYAPMEINARNGGGGQQTEQERGRAKFQSLFPGVYVTTTVEGSYQNLRRFIRELETSDQFVVISSIEIQPAGNDDKSNQNNSTQEAQINSVEIKPNFPQPNPNFPNNPNFPPGIQPYPNMPQTQQQQQQTSQVKVAPRGRTRGETVALRLEMAAYFRRPNYQPTTETLDTSVTIEK